LTENYFIGSKVSWLKERDPSVPIITNEVIQTSLSLSPNHQPASFDYLAVILISPKSQVNSSVNFTQGFKTIRGFLTSTSKSMISISYIKSNYEIYSTFSNLIKSDSLSFWGSIL